VKPLFLQRWLADQLLCFITSLTTGEAGLMAVLAVDVYSMVGIGLCLVTFISFGRVAWHQYNYVKKFPVAFRMAVLSLRAAAVIPGFAICYWLSLLIPEIYAGMQLPEAFLQAYCVFCFFALIAFYVGGPTKCVEVFRTSSHTFPDCLFGCMNRTPERCYYHAYLAVWQFMFIRPFVVVAVIVAFYADQNSLSLLLSAITTAQAAWGVGGLVKFYHVLYEYCKGLNMTKKIFVVKTIIGLILFQAFLEQVLFSFGFINMGSDGLQSFSAEDNAIRFYCFAVLVELVIFCVLVERTFAYKIDVNKGKNFDAAVSFSGADDIERHINSASPGPQISSSMDAAVSQMSFRTFLYYVGTVLDVFAGVRMDQLLENINSNTVSSTDNSTHSTQSTFSLRDRDGEQNNVGSKAVIAMVDFKSSTTT
jgi:hypothetical protein